ncbi:XdhC family protein [Armatimonas sp.]|uniref:XdhC family protein n=1 Tax=Armatimonas sp. TaxID=1872638 RepID=UPI00375192BC
MTELLRVSQTAQAAFAAGESAILATVIRVGGSTYRRPGARMLLTESGWAAGSISGGCLETDVLQKAWWRTDSGPARVVYDSTQEDEDIEWGFGLGCNGVVEVLLERLDSTNVAHLARLERWQTERTLGVLATTGEGKRLALAQDGAFWGEESLLAGAQEALEKRQSFWRDQTFYELVAPPQRLIIFGAGHDVVPLVKVATELLGWQVIVVDSRSLTPHPERFPGASVVSSFPLDTLELSDAAVLMTHSFRTDQELLPPLLASPVGYVGLLGPRRRAERLLEAFPPSDGGRGDGFRAPLGLDIGADNPEEIALALVAEIRAWSAGRSGGPLTHREGPIH